MSRFPALKLHPEQERDQLRLLRWDGGVLRMTSISCACENRSRRENGAEDEAPRFNVTFARIQF